MEAQQLQSLAEQFIDALHRLEQGDDGAIDAIVDLFADDARLTNAALRLAGGERRGRDGVRHFWTEYRNTFDRAQSEFFKMTTGDGAAGLFWTTSGTGSDGKPVEYDGASLLVFDDAGKITLFRGYYDTRQLTLEVGSP